MKYILYKVTLEVSDRSASDGEDIELLIEEALEALPEDLRAHVIEMEEVDE